MKKKYELLKDDFIEVDGRKLYRIRALRGFGGVEKGKLGGYIEREENLSHYGNAWVFGNAWVYGDARVYGNTEVSGDARVFGNARVYGDANITSNNDYCCFSCFGSANRTTTAYKTKDGHVEIVCGCFQGTIGEFAARVEETHGDNKFGREYKAIIEAIKAKFGIKSESEL